jgi:hypothetical protein
VVAVVDVAALLAEPVSVARDLCVSDLGRVVSVVVVMLVSVLLVEVVEVCACAVRDTLMRNPKSPGAVFRIGMVLPRDREQGSGRRRAPRTCAGPMPRIVGSDAEVPRSVSINARVSGSINAK